jgi:hypothetical protein
VNVSEDFEEFFAYLNKRQVRFLVVGGYAFAFHAIPRYTKDIDLLVQPDPGNAQRLMLALEDFGFGDVGLVQEDFEQAGRIIRLGQEPNCIDLITSIKGVDFSEAWAGRISGKYGKTIVNFLGRSELIKNKESVLRPQDIADVAILRELGLLSMNSDDGSGESA